MSHREQQNFAVRRKELMKPLRNPHTGSYRVIYLCPVAHCGKPLERRNGTIVCPVDAEHYTEVIQKWE